MVGKRVQLDDETWAALEVLMSERDVSFQDLADEAFKDLLKKARSAGRPEGRAERERGGQRKERKKGR